MAARQASRVSSSGSIASRRPTADCPMPVMATRFSMYVSLGRHHASASARTTGSTRRLRVLVVLEHDLHRHADPHVLGRAVDDVGGQAQARLLLDLDVGDDVRQLGTGHPGLVVDGEAGDRGPAAHRLRSRCPCRGRPGRWVGAGGCRSRSAGSAGTPAGLPAPLPEVAVAVGHAGKDPEDRFYGRHQRTPFRPDRSPAWEPALGEVADHVLLHERSDEATVLGEHVARP